MHHVSKEVKQEREAYEPPCKYTTQNKCIPYYKFHLRSPFLLSFMTS